MMNQYLQQPYILLNPPNRPKHQVLFHAQSKRPNGNFSTSDSTEAGVEEPEKKRKIIGRFCCFWRQFFLFFGCAEETVDENSAEKT